MALKTFKQLREEVWDKPNPKKTHGHMTPAQKSEAKRRAKAAGRPYPNLVDNMAAMKEELTPEEQFDLIEDVVEDIAKDNNVDSELIWEDLESIPDEELIEVAAWQRKEGKNPEGGLNAKGIAAYRRENPGSKLQMAVTTKPSKLKPGSKAANRRKSFCARMGGMKKRLTSAKTARDPDSRINKALRKWNC